jgi:hypothetical protein
MDYGSLGLERFDGTEFFDISNYGWYDYKIWKAKSSDKEVSGYFDSSWKTMSY